MNGAYIVFILSEHLLQGIKYRQTKTIKVFTRITVFVGRFYKAGNTLEYDAIVFVEEKKLFIGFSDVKYRYNRFFHFNQRTKALATPPSTFNTLPVDLFKSPPTKRKQAFAISSGRIVSFNSVRFA